MIVNYSNSNKNNHFPEITVSSYKNNVSLNYAIELAIPHFVKRRNT